MKIGHLLPVERIVVPLPAATLHDGAEQLVGTFVETGLAQDGGALLDRLAETPAREAVTAGGNAFILHFRSDVLTGVGAALGITNEPVVLETGSDRMARVIAVLVAPYKESSIFLQTVSALNRILSSEDVCGALHRAESAQAVTAVGALLQADLPGYLRVVDVMHQRPRSILPDAPLEDAARVMVANRVSSLAVTSEGGEVLGMVSHQDILRVALPGYLKRMSSGEYVRPKAGAPTPEQDPRRVPIRDVMDRSVLCVSEEQTLAEVSNIFIGKGVDRFPVVRDGILVGMLTRGDIVRRLYGP